MNNIMNTSDIYATRYICRKKSGNYIITTSPLSAWEMIDKAESPSELMQKTSTINGKFILNEYSKAQMTTFGGLTERQSLYCFGLGYSKENLQLYFAKQYILTIFAPTSQHHNGQLIPQYHVLPCSHNLSSIESHQKDIVWHHCLDIILDLPLHSNTLRGHQLTHYLLHHPNLPNLPCLRNCIGNRVWIAILNSRT